MMEEERPGCECDIKWTKAAAWHKEECPLRIRYLEVSRQVQADYERSSYGQIRI